VCRASGDIKLPPSPGPAPLSALERVTALLDALEAAVDTRLDREAEFADADAEVQRMNVDRARLAQELDTAEARAERLSEVNREVSRRLVAAMETIRAVIDR
jgi:chromosome segregation ATPase